ALAPAPPASDRPAGHRSTVLMQRHARSTRSKDLWLRTLSASLSVSVGRLVRPTYSPSVAASAAISAVVLAKLKASPVIFRSKCFLGVEHAAHRKRDRGGTAQRVAFAGGGRFDAGG